MATNRLSATDSHSVRKWRINRMCLLGASVGIIATFLTWMYIPLTMPGPGDPSHKPTILFMASGPPHATAIGDLYISAAVLFLVGTLIALAIPVGGFSQLASIVMFAYGIVESGSHTPLDGIDQQQSPGPGMILGVASLVMVSLSMSRRFGGGKIRVAQSEPISLKERLLTINFSRMAE